MRTRSMGTWIARISIVGLYVAVLVGGVALTSARAFAVDCDSGCTEERVACLSQKVADLTAKVEELSKETLKWNDRIALRNEEHAHLPKLPRESRTEHAWPHRVFANSCAKIPAQTWMISKPYQ